MSDPSGARTSKLTAFGGVASLTKDTDPGTVDTFPARSSATMENVHVPSRSTLIVDTFPPAMSPDSDSFFFSTVVAPSLYVQRERYSLMPEGSGGWGSVHLTVTVSRFKGCPGVKSTGFTIGVPTDVSGRSSTREESPPVDAWFSQKMNREFLNCTAWGKTAFTTSVF